MSRTTHPTARSARLVALLLLGLLTRALVPAGFMPGAQGLKFCSGTMSPTVGTALAHAHYPSASTDAPAPGTPRTPASQHEGCVFAGCAAGLAAASLAPIALPVPDTSRHDGEFTKARIHVAPIDRVQTSRGPPALLLVA